MAKWQDTFKKLKKRKEEVDKTSSPSEIKQIDTSYDNVMPSIRDVNGLRNPGSTYNTLDVSSVLLGTYATKVKPTVTNPTLYGMNSKPTVTPETETVESTVKSENKTPTVNADGYKETGKTYGDYWYQEYGKRKDEKIYEKDGKYYLYSNGTYQDVDKVSYMTDKKTDKKTLQEAKKEGYKGSKSSLAHISDQLKLDTENLSKDEYKEYESDLKRQQDKHEKELARKSEVQYSGAGLKGSLGTLKTYASNVGNKVDDEIATPLKYAKDNYEVGKLNNELALEYYNKMEGKSNKVDKLKKKVDTYNKFNKDLLEEPGALGTAIQQANTQVESLKHQGVAASVLGLGGATAGALLTRTPQGALAGAKAGGMAGYTLGSTPYTYKLEAGNQYQTLTEMGVPDKVAKKYSKITGVVNASIESGENILDLATLGISAAKGTTAVSKEAVNSMVEDYGESTVKKWLTKKFGEESANKIVNVAKTGAASYVQNIGSEALEESLQESTSVGTERLATKEAGIERKATARDDLNRILEAGKTAAISTAFTSPLTSIGGSIVTHTINNVDAKLQNKVRNKTITETELNNEIKSVIENTEKEEGTSLSTEEVKQIQANVQQQVQDNGITITNDDIAPVKTSNTTTQETNSNLLVEAPSSTVNNKNKISDGLIREIQYKTRKANENRPNVEIASTSDIFPNERNGGYRTVEQINELTNYIKSNGIENPIEVKINKDGNIEVVNGNHRLKIAKQLGLKEVPIKYVNSKMENVDNSQNILYNKENEKDLNYINEDYKNGIRNNKEVIENNDRSGNIKEYSISNSVKAENEGTARKNDKISNKISRYNDGSSSTSTYAQNTGIKGLDNSSFFNDEKSLKSKQLEVINKNNAAPDDYHTWIRSKDDIKTFDEAFFEEGEYSGFDHDFTENMAKESKKTGKVTVYSSYPIEDGVFVSPSKLEASQYAGGDESKLYSKEVNINDVAWIDGAEGQYAKVEGTQSDTQETQNGTQIKSLEERVSGDALLDAQDFIDEVKSVGADVDKNGYITVYHQTTNENAEKIKQTGKMSAKEQYVYFSTSKDASQSDGRGQAKLEFKIPAEKLTLDDLFSDNADVKIPLENYMKESLDVSDYLVRDTKETSLSRSQENGTPTQQELDNLKDAIAPIKESIDDLKNLTKEFKKVKSEISDIKEDLAPIKGYMEQDISLYNQANFDNLEKQGIVPVYENKNPNYNSWEEAMIDMNKPKAQKEKYEAMTPQKTSNEPKMSRVKAEDIAPVKQPQLKIDPEMDAAFDKFAKSFIDKKNELKERKKSKPKVETKTKSKLGRAWDTFQETMVNRNRQIDNLAKETGNSEIKFKGDRMNNISGEIGGDIFTAQTDNYGNAIGKSLDAPFAEARKQGLDAYFDGYLKNLSNIERHEQGKGSAVVSAEESKALVKAYEEKYPVLKDLANDVYTYNQNMLNNAVENGIIDNEFRDRLISMYGKYVPFYENDMENTPGMNMSPDEIRGSKPIKRAKGGSDANLQSVEQAMMKQTYAWKNAIVKNDLYKEIVNSINDKVSIGGDIRENPTLLSDSLYSDESGKYLTAYVDGQQQTVKIGDELFSELNRDLDKQIRNYEEKLSLVTKPLQKLSQIRGQILTTYNPSFVITNPFKDIQDALLNTKNLKGYAQNLTATMQDSKRAKNINTYANDFKTITGQDITSVTDPSSLTGTAKKLYKKYQGGVMWNRFITSYGTNATSMEYGNNNVDTKAKNKGFLNKIANANDYMEVMFRYPEFKAALKEGKSFTEALYNAREITTNFGRGGTISKAINRNGATFFNTSIQGLDKFVRNFSGENGARGFIGAVSKAAMLGIAPSVLNHLLSGGLGGDADDDYEALPDYVKDNYYVFKRDNGEFIRIPKGRMISVLGSAARRTLELAQGEKNAFEGFLSNAESQVGSTNPLKENIFSPLIQAYGSENGEAWYGGDLVPSRLQDLPTAEQYDESTDELSKLIGKVFNISPYKVNYVIDQYSGGLGDILLPMSSKKASNDSDSFGDYLLAPIKDKFVVNSTDDNKFAGELFDMSDELTTKANSSNATDEDKLKNQYINSVKSDMSKLYQKKREIQNSDLSKSEKYKQVQEIQDQINQMSKDALNTYEKGKYESNYASFGDTEFYKYKNSDGEESWKQIKEDEADELNSMGLTSSEKNKYFISKTKIGDIAGVYKESKKGLDEDDDDYKETIASLSDDKKESIIDTILKTDLPDEAKEYLYSKNYSSEKSLDKITKAGTSIDTYLTFEKDTLRFEADKNEEGKTISGSLNNKYEEYLLNSELSDTDKINLYEHAVLSGFDEEDKYTDYKTIKAAGVDIDTWLSFDSQEFKSDKNKNGKSVSGSKKKKVISYVNALDLSIPQKAMMIRTKYSSFNNYNNQIVQYVEDLEVSYDDKVKMIKGSGMKVSDNGTVSW